jgi:hypothetical protein
MKAAQQALAEALGFDEARVYYLMLTKQEKSIESEFSYSKRYRIMKSLFESSALGKFKPNDKDSFLYMMLPPSFLYFNEEGSFDVEVIRFLEGLYLKNHSKLLEEEFSQMIIKDERPILVFLLKYFMKEKASLLAQELNLKKILGSRSDKVILLKKGEEARRMGSIDKSFFFEFVKIPNKEETEYIGYLSHEPAENSILH